MADLVPNLITYIIIKLNRKIRRKNTLLHPISNSCGKSSPQWENCYQKGYTMDTDDGRTKTGNILPDSNRYNRPAPIDNMKRYHYKYYRELTVKERPKQ